jgi:lysine biosynthesis protein LysW
MADVSNKVVCPDCGFVFKTDLKTVVGDILECQTCGTEVEILSLEPLKYQELIEEK